MSPRLSFPKRDGSLPAVANSSKDGKGTAAIGLADPWINSFWRRMLSGTKITAGVNNAFDRNPPTVLGGFNDTYDTSLYSIRNRYYYVGLSKKF